MRNSSREINKRQQKNAKSRTNLESVIDMGAMLRQSAKFLANTTQAAMAKSYNIESSENGYHQRHGRKSDPVPADMELCYSKIIPSGYRETGADLRRHTTNLSGCFPEIYTRKIKKPIL